MSGNKKCPICGNRLPETRKGDAIYCSKACYSRAKRLRDKAYYDDLRKRKDEEKYNETILVSCFWAISSFGAQIYLVDLAKAGLNLGYSNGEGEIKGVIWKRIGSYGYSVDPKTKQVCIQIWK